MTVAGAITTIAGGFVFAFLASTCWAKMTEDWRSIGGWMAAAFIGGTCWVLNHKLPGPGFSKDIIEQGGLVVQAATFEGIVKGVRLTGTWVDQSCAVGFGLWIGSIYAGGSVRKSLPSLACAIAGGALGGAILGLVGK